MNYLYFLSILLKKEIIKMHNIKEIRKDIHGFKESMKKRFLDLDVDRILELDENNRKYIQKKEILEKEKKISQNYKT